MSSNLPTSEELWALYREEELEELHDKVRVDDYMNIHTAVFKHPDGRLFRLTYEADGQGNYNTWRDETGLDVEEVEAYSVTTTAYRKKG